MTTFPGIIPAVVVPFADDDSIDVDALRANVGHLIEGGVHGLVVNGTMGEAGALSDDERGVVIATVMGVSDGRLPVTVGVSSTSTAAACGRRITLRGVERPRTGKVRFRLRERHDWQCQRDRQDQHQQTTHVASFCAIAAHTEGTR